MNDIPPRPSPPFPYSASSAADFFKVLQGQMDVAATATDQAVAGPNDAGGSSTAPVRTASGRLAAKSLKDANDRNKLGGYLDYCKGLLDLTQYTDLPEADRAVIADFFSGELLQDVQWKHLFPDGKFQCNLSTTPGPDTDDYTCTESTVLRINFEEVLCSKEILRVWTPKQKSIDEPISGAKKRKQATRSASKASSSSSSSSSSDDDDNLRNESLELQSPIKQSMKRRTPTRRRSFEERDDRRRSNSRATSTRSISAERQTKKPKATAKKAPDTASPKKGRGRPKKASVPKKKQEDVVAVAAPDESTYEVQSILECKKAYGKYRYLVRWAGLSAEGKPWEDTWEPAVNISDDLIRDFWARSRQDSNNGSTVDGDHGAKSPGAGDLLDSEPAQLAA